MQGASAGMDYEDFCRLAKMVHEAEDESEEECDAEARFFDAVEDALPEDVYDKLDDYMLKATLPERINEGLKVMKDHFGVS